MAIDAYYIAVTKLVSIYAWQKLFILYSKVENYRALLICMAECLDDMEMCGISQFETLPLWMEKHLANVINVKGIKFIKDIIVELQI